MQDLQDELKDEKHVYSSRLYTLLNDQLLHWNNQVDRYKGLTDSLQVKLALCCVLDCALGADSSLIHLEVQLQAEKSSILRWEKELNMKLESLEVTRNAIDNGKSGIEELEIQLQKCIVEKNELEIKMEEAVQDSG